MAASVVSPAFAADLEVADRGSDDLRDAAAAGGAEIIVTAERRAASVQKTPVAVGVIGADDIAREGVKRLWDANGSVAGLYLGSYPSNMQYISIRGIGANDPGTFAAVGYYLDDVYLGRSFGRGAIGLPDIDRIEVLRGPQGTLYGQNTTGGAIKFVSRDPSLNDPYNWASVSIGNLGAREAHLYLSAPIVEGRLSAAVAYSHRADEGGTYNAFRQLKVNRTSVDQIRAKLRWKPSERLEFVLSLDGTRDSSDNYISTPNNAPGINRPRLVYANTDTQLSRNDFGQTLRISYELSDKLSLKSISAHRRDRNDPHPWDTDGLPTDLFGWSQRFTEEVFSQEVQVSGDYSDLKFTLGANIYDETFDFDRLQWLALNYTNLESRVGYTSYAIYGQGNYRITPRLGVTIGGRYSWEKQAFDAASFRSDPLRQRLAVNYSVQGLKDKQQGFTPKFGIDYQLSGEVFVYASYTVGEKSGGFNRAAGTLLVASIPVAPEKVKTTEAGIKITALDRRLTLNVAGFYNKFVDYQASVTNPVINGSVVNGNVVVNAGNAHTKGVEVETSLRASDRLQLRGTLALLRSRFDSFVNPTGAADSDFTGNQLPSAPRLTASAGATYGLPLGDGGQSIRLNASVNYIQRNFGDIANNVSSRGVSRAPINAGVEYQSPKGRWNLSLLVKNLFNKTYRLSTSLIPALGVNNSQYNPPRTLLATIRHAF